MQEPELKRPGSSKRVDWISVTGYLIAGLVILASFGSYYYFGRTAVIGYTLIAIGAGLLMLTIGYRLLNSNQSSDEFAEMRAAIEEKLDEKDMLLKEVHHRVKNNLQTVCSLLNMQSRGTDDEQMKNLIKSSQNRVMAMAMVHEMLYLRDDLSTIDYKPYVFKLPNIL